MREFLRFGVRDFVLLAGHLADEVRAAVPAILASLPMDVKIVVSEEPVRAGTGGALAHAHGQLDERFWLCNGDSFLDCNLAGVLAEAAGDPSEVAVRMVLREVEDASRFGVVDLAGGKVTAFRERAVPGEGGLINGGIYIVNRAVLAETPPVCSLERDVLPKLALEGRVRGAIAEGYFVDIGIPADLDRARRELPRRLRRPALFLDRDDVINQDCGLVGERARFDWVLGAMEAIRHANEGGVHVFVVTNQAESHHDGMVDMLHAAGATIDDIRYRPCHDEAVTEAYGRVSDWCKPAPGMILDLIQRWELDPIRCALVGDKLSDVAAAAGISGHLLDDGNLLTTLRRLLRNWAHA